MSVRPAVPSLFCEDFALVPSGEHEGKPAIAFGRPVNLLSAAGVGGGDSHITSYALVLNLDGRLYVRDLSGNSELRHNGREVLEAELRHDDRVRLGPTEYRVSATRFAEDTGAQTGRPDADLIPTQGGPSHPLRPPVTLVGECEQADIRLPSNGSPESCVMILRVGGGYWLWNLDPTVPSTVNGQAVTRAPLANGNSLGVGGTEFYFRMRSPALPAGVAAATPPRVIIEPSPVQPKPEPETVAEPAPVADAAGQRNVPARRSGPKPAPTQQELDDEADGFKQWGPLAFAVAAADRPELHGAGSKTKTPAHAAAAAPEEVPKGMASFLTKLFLALIVLAALAAGAYFAWRKWGR
jgi:hypothetical protein